MSEEDIEELKKVQPQIDEARQKYHSLNYVQFMIYLNETFVSESKRATNPSPEVQKNKRKLSRWFVGKVVKHLHPDAFVTEDRSKFLLMQEIMTLANKINNMLKGF